MQSPTFEEQFRDENKMPEVFYQWLTQCPVLWIRGEVHSDYLTYKFDSSGKVLDMSSVEEPPSIEFAEDKPKSKRKSSKKH